MCYAPSFSTRKRIINLNLCEAGMYCQLLVQISVRNHGHIIWRFSHTLNFTPSRDALICTYRIGQIWPADWNHNASEQASIDGVFIKRVLNFQNRHQCYMRFEQGYDWGERHAYGPILLSMTSVYGLSTPELVHCWMIYLDISTWYKAYSFFSVDIDCIC